MKVKEILITSNYYPNRLRDIEKAPEKLYVLGNEKILETDGIAVIGSRAYSEYGKIYATKFAKELAQQGLTIISGMAKGIDAFAHEGALKVKGKTIAVLGGGFNYIYPEENIGLMEEILKKGGTVISEYPPDTEPNSKRFVERNRIVSGLSIGVLVIEAMYRSGTSITAKLAKEQYKTVFCLPSNLDRKNGIGTNKLIKEGAKLVTEANDILDYFKIKRIKINNENKTMEIPKEYQAIYEAIGSEPIQVDAICKKLSTNMSNINSTLMLMELEGYIKSLPGNYIERVNSVL